MRDIKCIHASESGFYNGVPLTIEPEPLSHKDSILIAIQKELSCERTQSVQNAIDSAILWLESVHEQ